MENLNYTVYIEQDEAGDYITNQEINSRLVGIQNLKVSYA